MAKRSEKRIQKSGPRLKSLTLLVSMIFICVIVGVESAYGHGVGSETFPPVNLDGKLVTLEVSSSQSDPETSDDQQISISLLDFDSKVTLRDVTFLVKAERGDQYLFKQEFNADNGFIVFNFVSKDNDSITLKEAGVDFFGSLLGLESRMVHVKGPGLSEGGLYKFDVNVLAANGYSQTLDEPLVFNAGISIPQTSRHDIVDPNFGKQSIEVITYYDEISNFNYNPDSRKISFFMPFEWSQSNINQTSVVHQEVVIPKEFGDLLVSGFLMRVNGVELSKDVVNIDDFVAEERVVHFIIYQKELQNIFSSNQNQNGMEFVISPDRNYTHLSSVTENGQFKLLVHWEPKDLKSDSDAKILFDVTDIFLKNKPVATNYDFSVTQNDRIIFEQSGTSSDSKIVHNTAEFTIPSDVSGIIHLNFQDLDDNSLAKSTIPIVVNRISSQSDDTTIPKWIKSNALWWSENQIDDATFVSAIEYLIKNDIILIPQTQQGDVESQDIPSWIKNNAGWWATGCIDDKTFVQGLEYLIANGIIRI